MFPYCKLKEDQLKAYMDSVTPAMVEKSLSSSRPAFSDFLHMISPAAADLKEHMRTSAAAVKKMHFGKTVRLYSPLYISNFCINECLYCGFRQSFGAERKRLSLDEIITDARILKGYGIDSLLLVSGEDPKYVSVDFLEQAVRELKKIFSYISMEIYPLDSEGYKRLFKAGVHGLTLYQETYERELYERLHGKGPKSDYDARLKAVSDGADAGFYNVGVGALLGLYDWRTEAVSMAAHAIWLRKKFWRTKVQFSFPRITPVDGGFEVPAPVSEEELEQMMLAFRLFFHEADIYISTRESHEFRKKIVNTCASHMSAASQVVPGGYRQAAAGELGQFTVNDTSPVKLIKDELERDGLEAVFKDWDCSISPA